MGPQRASPWLKVLQGNDGGAELDLRDKSHPEVWGLSAARAAPGSSKPFRAPPVLCLGQQQAGKGRNRQRKDRDRQEKDRDR